MLQSLQPHRPQTTLQPRSPLNQQQIRASHAQTSPYPAPSSAPAAARAPRTQIEAMPPTLSTTLPVPPIRPSQQHLQPQQWPQPRPVFFDPAMCHPVFFTATLRRPPFPPLRNPAIAAGVAFNPVAFGYINETNGARKEGNAKL